MKQTPLLNQPISALIAGLGHGDEIVVADCGLPIAATCRIDIALKRGVPGFLETIETVLTEMKVESVVIASEMRSENPTNREGLATMLPATPVTEVSHVELKRRASQAKGVIRTGENTPYANAILIAGVSF